MIIKYNTADSRYKSEYYVVLDDNIWIYKDMFGNVHFIGGKCKMVYMKGVLNGEELSPFAPNRQMRNYQNFCYNSLDDALQKIYDYETNVKLNAVIAHTSYDIVYLNNGNNIVIPINNKRDQLLVTMT